MNGINYLRRTTIRRIITLSFITAITTSAAIAQINHYVLNDTIIGVGNIMKDIDNNGTMDYDFQIIALAPPNGLAARVVSQGSSEFLDNSTFGYPDALDAGDTIDGDFNTGNGVFGTFNSAGQFKGLGPKYLGIKVKDGSNDHYGWVKVSCSDINDTLIIYEVGYNTAPGGGIAAGQDTIDISTGIAGIGGEENEIGIYPNPAVDVVCVKGLKGSASHSYSIFDLAGKTIAQGKFTSRIDVSAIPEGTYILRTDVSNDQKLIIKR